MAIKSTPGDMKLMSELGPKAIVTGASRGAGKSIARALGSHGCTVYVTGRSQTDADAEMPGTIYSTAEAHAQFRQIVLPYTAGAKPTVHFDPV